MATEPVIRTRAISRFLGVTQTAVIDPEDVDTAEGIDLPGADLSHEEFTVAVIPEQANEFTCASCFLVRHRSQLTRSSGGAQYCTDCEN